MNNLKEALIKINSGNLPEFSKLRQFITSQVLSSTNELGDLNRRLSSRLADEIKIALSKLLNSWVKGKLELDKYVFYAAQLLFIASELQKDPAVSERYLEAPSQAVSNTDVMGADVALQLHMLLGSFVKMNINKKVEQKAQISKYNLASIALFTFFIGSTLTSAFHLGLYSTSSVSFIMCCTALGTSLLALGVIMLGLKEKQNEAKDKMRGKHLLMNKVANDLNQSYSLVSRVEAVCLSTVVFAAALSLIRQGSTEAHQKLGEIFFKVLIVIHEPTSEMLSELMQLLEEVYTQLPSEAYLALQEDRGATLNASHIGAVSINIEAADVDVGDPRLGENAPLLRSGAAPAVPPHNTYSMG